MGQGWRTRVKAVDTNILARYIVRDDARQAAIAEAILVQGVYLPATVLLETGWLLGSRYGMGRADVASTLEDLLQLPGIVCEDTEWIAWAIARFAQGADFADMIHLVAARSAEAFVTFDRIIVKAAGSQPPLPVEIPDR